MSDQFLGGEKQAVPAALFRYAPLLLLVVAWELSTRTGLLKAHILPPLSQVATSWFSLAVSGDLLSNGASSLYRTFAGLGLAIIVGGAVGILMGWSRLFDASVGPLVRMF